VAKEEEEIVENADDLSGEKSRPRRGAVSAEVYKEEDISNYVKKVGKLSKIVMNLSTKNLFAERTQRRWY